VTANGAFCRFSTVACRGIFVGDAKTFVRANDAMSNLKKVWARECKDNILNWIEDGVQS
jgi:hypothetical protein